MWKDCPFIHSQKKNRSTSPQRKGKGRGKESDKKKERLLLVNIANRRLQDKPGKFMHIGNSPNKTAYLFWRVFPSVTSWQRRRIPRQAWRYFPKKGCTWSTVALRYIWLDNLLWIVNRSIRQSSKILDIQTANGVVVSDTQATVYIKELGASLWVHLVEDSPSVLLGRLCNELGYSYWWPSGETPRLSKSEKAIECSIENFVSVVAVSKHKAVPSIEFSSAKGNFERDHGVEDAMLDLF